MFKEEQLQFSTNLMRKIKFTILQEITDARMASNYEI